MRVRCSQVALMLYTSSSALYVLPLISVPTCHQGLQVQDYFGNFCKRVPTDIDLPAVSKSNWFKIVISYIMFFISPFYILKMILVVQIDSDKTVMVTFKHDDKFQENAECGFQVMNNYFFCFSAFSFRKFFHDNLLMLFKPTYCCSAVCG